MIKQTLATNQRVSAPAFFLVGSFTLGMVSWSSCPLQAQQAAPATPAPVTTETALEWENDAALKAKVSFEARSRPLKQLLADVQKQSGVKIGAGANSPTAAFLVTARVKEMPLSSLMQALSRIYGVTWVRNGDASYSLQEPTGTALALQMARSRGLSPSYQIQRDVDAQRERDAILAREVLDSVETEAWQSPEGVPFTSLPDDVQRTLRQRVEQGTAEGVVGAAQSAGEVFEHPLQLRLGLVSPQDKGFFAHQMSNLQAMGFFSRGRGTELGVYTSDGRFVVNIFPAFRGPTRVELAQSNPLNEPPTNEPPTATQLQPENETEPAEGTNETTPQR
jgi:hypothetical protein